MNVKSNQYYFFNKFYHSYSHVDSLEGSNPRPLAAWTLSTTLEWSFQRRSRGENRGVAWMTSGGVARCYPITHRIHVCHIYQHHASYGLVRVSVVILVEIS